MSQFLFTRPGLVALSTAVISSMGVLIGTPANGATFKGMIYETYFPHLEGFEIEYTLADGIFDTILASAPNTFFIDGDYLGPAPSLPMSLATVVPEVVTDLKTNFKVGIEGDRTQPVLQLSLFGITEEGLFLQLLDVNQPPIYQNIFKSTIQAPEGLPLSACKTQACDASADFGGKGGFYGSRMIVTPVPEPESVPEPSAAVALSVVGVLFLKRPRKAVTIPAVVTADSK
ncbi:PEP-CTERM sorting domain-containing protein [Laspinema olomoucense]|uniref:PEP-CTERM sorting domain-containing protein n=1 Tax=Laspinema olomoucense TaxID=3231600 RepID=UPI0021BAAA17|nr:MULTISPECIES: PEP-CTERM sorting domain-containing protein [unclassified Laspinema]MCT7973529.1 PEP-CTERM sorting domain-containing protein [Laspinema sp. D3d]MCT7995072.1 PEP-CTERM sorting domain-containing protein [Laspinema sp. D3c]